MNTKIEIISSYCKEMSEVLSDCADSTKSSSLPLGWTRVRRRSNDTNAQTQTLSCCPSCNEDEKEDGQPRASSSSLCSNNTNISHPLVGVDAFDIITWKGRAIFCLHEIDCTWFQGYFFPDDSVPPFTSSSFGLLATTRHDMDDCLHCEDSGYRFLDISLFLPMNAIVRRQGRQLRFERVQGIGGDMMSLESQGRLGTKGFEHIDMGENSSTLLFQPDHFYTDAIAEPFLQKYFAHLVTQLSHRSSPTSAVVFPNNLIDVIPDCAIVVGQMTISFPASCLKNDA